MSETPKQAEFRAVLTRATNTSFDCGEYEFYAGEPVEENYAQLAEKASAAHAKVIEMYAELERENARLQMELDASCNAEELRQYRHANQFLIINQGAYERENARLLEALKWAEPYVPKRADCETRRMIESLLPNA